MKTGYGVFAASVIAVCLIPIIGILWEREVLDNKNEPCYIEYFATNDSVYLNKEEVPMRYIEIAVDLKKISGLDYFVLNCDEKKIKE